jgi:hemin uptake protein HemP
MTATAAAGAAREPISSRGAVLSTLSIAGGDLQLLVMVAAIVTVAVLAFLRRTALEELVRLGDAFPTARTDAQVLLEVGHRPAPKCDGAADFALGYGVADADVHRCLSCLLRMRLQTRMIRNTILQIKPKGKAAKPMTETRPPSTSEPRTTPESPDPRGAAILESEALFKGKSEVVIRHAGREYRLRRTRFDKLILTA